MTGPGCLGLLFCFQKTALSRDQWLEDIAFVVRWETGGLACHYAKREAKCIPAINPMIQKTRTHRASISSSLKGEIISHALCNSQACSFVYSFNNYLWSTYHIPDSVLGARDSEEQYRTNPFPQLAVKINEIAYNYKALHQSHYFYTF